MIQSFNIHPPRPKRGITAEQAGLANRASQAERKRVPSVYGCSPPSPGGKLLLHPLTGKTGRIILYRKFKYKRDFVIGGLGDWWILSHAETQRGRERRGYFGVVTSLKE